MNWHYSLGLNGINIFGVLQFSSLLIHIYQHWISIYIIL